jgi:hypothetical protein
LLSPALTGIPDADVDRITHLNAMRVFQYDPFAVRPREQCTVGALRASAADVDVSERAVTGAKPRDPGEPPITIMSIVAAATAASPAPE